MKKLINAPDAVVSEALVGMEAAHPELTIDHEKQIIYRSDAPVAGRVGVISGGGSGHEPMHGGYVGMGLLTAWGSSHSDESEGPRHGLCGTPLEVRWYCPTCDSEAAESEDAWDI